MDVAQGCAAQANRGGNVRKLTLHQHDICRVNRDIRAGADGDADIRTGERGRVVDAVADHGDLALFLQSTDDAFLALGEDARDDLVYAHLTPDGTGGALVVAGQHDDADAHVAQSGDGGGAVLFDDVCNGDDARQPAAFGKEQRRFAFLGKRFRLRAQIGRNLRLCRDKGQTAAEQFFTAQRGGQAVAGKGAEIGNFGDAELFFVGAVHDGAGEGVFAALFQRGGKGQQIMTRQAVGGDKIRYTRLASGDGAGFIECDNLGLAGFFERNGGLKKNAVLCTQTVADHDGNRSRQAQRTGAADDQHGNAARQRETDRFAAEQPNRCRKDGKSDDGRHKYAGYLVGNLCNRRFCRRRIGNHFDNLRKGRILADARGFAAQETGLIARCGGNAVANGFIDRNALSGQRRLVDGTFAL